MKKNAIFHGLLIVSASLGLSACSGLLNSDKPVEHSYWLEPYATHSSRLPSMHGRGLVVRFSVAPGLDSDRLLTLGPNAELNHVAGARWPEHLPEFAGSLVRRSLHNAGGFARVLDERDTNPKDCELDLHAQEFFTLLDGAGAAVSVQISMNGYFECRHVAHGVVLDANVPVARNSATGVVAAHQEAMDRSMRSLLDQLRALLAETEGE